MQLPISNLSIRRLHVSLSPVLVVVLASCGPVRTAWTPATGSLPLLVDSRDSALVDAAVRASGAAAGVRDLFPGFWAGEPAFIVYDPGRSAVLVSPLPPPAGFSPVSPLRPPGALRERLYLHRGALPGLSGTVDLAYPLLHDSTAVAVPADPRGGRSTLDRLFHEAFHTFQQRHFQQPQAVLPAEPPPARAPELTAMAEVERRILLAALDAPARDSLRSVLAVYAAVRSRRSRVADPQLTEAERRLERIEGSAQLVGHQAALVAMHGTAADAATAVREDLSMPLGSTSAERRRRVYGTGAALGLLLDRLGVEWRTALQRGATFDQVLNGALGPAPASDARVNAALADFGYAGLVQEFAATPATAAAQPDAEAKPDGFQLVVRVALVGTGAAAPRMNVDLGPEGAAQPEAGVSTFPHPELFSFEHAGLSLTARGHTVTVDARGSATALEVRVLLPSAPRVGGRRGAPGESRCVEDALIESQGLRAQTGASCLTWGERSLVVEPRSRDRVERE